VLLVIIGSDSKVLAVFVLEKGGKKEEDMKSTEVKEKRGGRSTGWTEMAAGLGILKGVTSL